MSGCAGRVVTMVLALVVGVASPALAQRAPKTDKERATLARESFEAGKKAYNLGDFDKAVNSWKQGYEYKDDPIFLFNIAQAYRQLSDYSKAIFFYKAYVREMPNAPNREDVEARIVEMQKLLDAQQSTTGAPPTGTLAPDEAARKAGRGGKGKAKAKTTETPTPQGEQPTPEPGPAPATDDPADEQDAPSAAVTPPDEDEGGAAPSRVGRQLKLYGMITVGAGVAFLATGVVFGLRASSIASDLEAATRDGGVWTAELADKEASGQSSNTIGIAAMSVGAVAAVGGGVLYYLGMQQDGHATESQRASLRILPQLGRATAGVSLHLDY